MKLIKLICLLFLIASQSIISLQTEVRIRNSKLSIKKIHSKRNKAQRFSSKAKARASARVRDAIDDAFKMQGSDDLLDFILGVLSVYYPPTAIFFTAKDIIKTITA